MPPKFKSPADYHRAYHSVHSLVADLANVLDPNPGSLLKKQPSLTKILKLIHKICGDHGLNFQNASNEAYLEYLKTQEEMRPADGSAVKFIIRAEISAQGHGRCEFDAASWFQRACEHDIDKLGESGWSGEPALRVAEEVSFTSFDLTHFFRTVGTADYKAKTRSRYVCTINRGDAHYWLRVTGRG